MTRASAGTSCRRCSASASASASRRWWAFRSASSSAASPSCRHARPDHQLLRPVSPLAWLPIGLLVFKQADPAATWTIFICSIWPMIINTAQGVQRVPQDYLNVARVLALSEWKIVTKILFPSVLPYMLTGIRLSIGTAWLVIVAAEMLTGGVGIGFWVWDEWNNLKVEHIIIAIFVIGIVGLLLEQALMLLARRSYGNS
jgi:nitrate/nitrite transport system permease protein